MYEVIDNQVLQVRNHTTSKQSATIKTYFDQVFHTKLTIDKPSILSDGIDTATITALIYNYLDETQPEWAGDIVFELDGQEQIVPTTNGVASITFNTSVTGEYTISTNIPNFRNAEIKVVAQ